MHERTEVGFIYRKKMFILATAPWLSHVPMAYLSYRGHMNRSLQRAEQQEMSPACDLSTHVMRKHRMNRSPATTQQQAAEQQEMSPACDLSTHVMRKHRMNPPATTQQQAAGNLPRLITQQHPTTRLPSRSGRSQAPAPPPPPPPPPTGLVGEELI